MDDEEKCKELVGARRFTVVMAHLHGRRDSARRKQRNCSMVWTSPYYRRTENLLRRHRMLY